MVEVTNALCKTFAKLGQTICTCTYVARSTSSTVTTVDNVLNELQHTHNDDGVNAGVYRPGGLFVRKLYSLVVIMK